MLCATHVLQVFGGAPAPAVHAIAAQQQGARLNPCVPQPLVLFRVVTHVYLQIKRAVRARSGDDGSDSAEDNAEE